ncbi:MAG: hypothetical protein LBD17_06705 [Endomicrobium sp.]|jgi:hypothetical protein|nr:hypothetical protein [Endomicrobium sp.]
MTRIRRISRYKISKIVECFVLDLTATQTAYIIGLINLRYKRFTEGIYKQQIEQFKEKVRGTMEHKYIEKVQYTKGLENTSYLYNLPVVQYLLSGHTVVFNKDVTFLLERMVLENLL